MPPHFRGCLSFRGLVKLECNFETQFTSMQAPLLPFPQTPLRKTMEPMRAFRIAILLCWSWFPLLLSATESADGIRIQSVTVNGKQEPFHQGQSLRLGSLPQNVSFDFGPDTNAAQAPFRIRYQLEGAETKWNGGMAFMYLAIRFYNEAGDQISQTNFNVVGDSAGWNGSLKTSPLVHRRETVIVPPPASRVWVVITSAGPPDSVGIFVVANLVLSKSSAKLPPVLLIQSPFDRQLDEEGDHAIPPGWIPDGTTPRMAKIIEIGQDPAQRAFAILDDSLTAHAEWHTTREAAPKVAPGEQLVVEWNEMYSVGIGGLHEARYPNLKTGTYRFHVVGLDSLGVPTGAQDTLTVLVPLPFWKESWFWSMVLVAFVFVAAGSWRYVVIQRMRREMLHLKHQQALEQERLRIAHDIHDDLGARATQISLFSAMSHDDPSFPEKARANFEQISAMSRELVSALYETVWAVNPENDNLDALGNYICQMVNQLCGRVQFPCRLDVMDLPREIQVSSQVRHNISMVVKEAVHNVIKHSKAPEVRIAVKFEKGLLAISIQDDGCGFCPEGNPGGNGLKNMKRRMADIGGSVVVDSGAGRGATVRLSLAIASADKSLEES